MKNGQIATLSAALLFRKGSATPAVLVNGRSGDSLGDAFSPVRKSLREPDPDGPVRVSLKLDRARRQHMLLAAAKLGWSNQELLLAALDHYLRSEVPAKIAGPCACLKSPTRPEPI